MIQRVQCQPITVAVATCSVYSTIGTPVLVLFNDINMHNDQTHNSNAISDGDARPKEIGMTECTINNATSQDLVAS